jgi:hypothetical protein
MSRSAIVTLLLCAGCSASSVAQPSPIVIVVPAPSGTGTPPEAPPVLEATLRAQSLIETDDGVWLVTLVVVARPPPSDGDVPLRFEWLPVVYVERALVEGDRIAERRVDVSKREPLIEVLTANFIDATTGRTTERVFMPLQLSRNRGFEAGEYRLRLKSQLTGDTVLETHVELQGENPLVDRRPGAFGP